MKKKLVVFFISICLISILIPASASNFKLNVDEKIIDNLDLDNTEFYALIIGIEEYAGFETPDQEYLDDTAIDFYEKLLSSNNWKNENIKLLLNENATKEKIHDAIIGWLDNKENESDIVVIYHASHGWKTKIKDRLKGNAYVFTRNSSGFEYGPDKITDKEYDSWVDELDSKHIAIILESCYSGRMLALRQAGREVLAAGGKYLFCPCNWSMYLKDTIFGFFLRQGLDGVADINNDGWITVREAYFYLRVPVIWHSLLYHYPFIWDTHWGKNFVGPQVPFLYDNHFGGLPFFKYN